MGYGDAGSRGGPWPRRSDARRWSPVGGGRTFPSARGANRRATACGPLPRRDGVVRRAVGLRRRGRVVQGLTPCGLPHAYWEPYACPQRPTGDTLRQAAMGRTPPHPALRWAPAALRWAAAPLGCATSALRWGTQGAAERVRGAAVGADGAGMGFGGAGMGFGGAVVGVGWRCDERRRPCGAGGRPWGPCARSWGAVRRALGWGAATLGSGATPWRTDATSAETAHHNAAGRVDRVERPGATWGTTLRTEFGYDPDDVLTAVTTPRTHIHAMGADLLGQPTSSTPPSVSGSITSTTRSWPGRWGVPSCFTKSG